MSAVRHPPGLERSKAHGTSKDCRFGEVEFKCCEQCLEGTLGGVTPGLGSHLRGRATHLQSLLYMDARGVQDMFSVNGRTFTTDIYSAINFRLDFWG